VNSFQSLKNEVSFEANVPRLVSDNISSNNSSNNNTTTLGKKKLKIEKVKCFFKGRKKWNESKSLENDVYLFLQKSLFIFLSKK
jgi:hypothetical protein